MDMIKEEISYIADVYADRPHFALQVTDENFGILKRDLEIAEHIRKVSDEKRYPRQMFYYSDKRFSETARGIVETLGDINTMGFQISLQSGNKKTLEAVKRKNLSEEDVKNAIEWASEKNIDTFTELIFGMPNETLDSFCDTLDDSSKRGFDSIQSYSLFLMAGIPLNTLENRKKYDIKTKLRLLSSSYAEIEGDFSVEHEEIVTATNTLSEQDFKSFRKISFMYYVVFRLSYYKHFFSFIQSLDISLSRFFKDFMDPDLAEEWPEDYIKFISDFNKESEDELFDNRESLIKRTKNNFRKNGNEVDKPTRLNPYFGARLVYIESVWIRGVLVKHLNKFENFNKSKIYKYLLNLVLDISENERIDIRNPKNNNVVLETKFDVIEWKKQKFIKPLNQFPIEEKTIYFNFSKNALDIIDGFANEYKNQEDPDFYYNAIDFILPRSNQLYDISYSMEKVKEAKNTTERLYENERIPV